MVWPLLPRWLLWVSNLTRDSLRGRISSINGYGQDSVYSFSWPIEYFDPVLDRWTYSSGDAASESYDNGRAYAGGAFDFGRDKFVIFAGFRNDTTSSGVGYQTHLRDTEELSRQSPGLAAKTGDHTLCAGGLAFFAVTPYGESDYQWFKGSVQIAGATSATLSIPSVTDADAGQYHFVATNSCGAITSQNELDCGRSRKDDRARRRGRPPCPGFEGRIIPATCTGTGPISIQLQKFDGEFWFDVPGQTTIPGVAIEVPSLQNSDTGLYRLKYSNTCATILSNSHYWQVGVTFSQPPASASVLPCETKQLTVFASGYGTLRYQWRHDGVALVNDGSRIFGYNIARRAHHRRRGLWTMTRGRTTVWSPTIARRGPATRRSSLSPRPPGCCVPSPVRGNAGIPATWPTTPCGMSP